RKKLLSIGVMVLSFILVFYFFSDINIRWVHHVYPYEVLNETSWYAGGYKAAILLVSFLLVLCVLSLVTRRYIPLVSAMGQNSLYAFLLHGFVVKYLIYIGFYRNFVVASDYIMLIIFGFFISFILLTPFVKNMTRLAVEPKVDFLFKSD